jgi:ABC-type spermidine/putrescine transport system permease subunit I
MNNNNRDIKTDYKYDTPTNIINKEGDFYRGMLRGNKSLTLRVASIVIALLVLIIPGLFILGYLAWGIYMAQPDIKSIVQILLVLPFWLGLILFVAGSIIVVKNIRK